MKVRVFREPCYFAEAVYLLHAFVNQVSFEEEYKRVAVSHSYALPDGDDADQIRLELMTHISRQATWGVDRENERLRFYFENLAGTDQRNACCLAQVMLMAIPLDLSDIDAFVARLLKGFMSMKRQGIKINDLNGMGLVIERWDTPGEPESLASQLERLPCGVEAKWQILRALTDFETHLKELTELIRPVVHRLKTEMAPLVAHNEETIARWENYFKSHTVDDFYHEMFNTTLLFAEDNMPHEIWLGLWCYNMLGIWSEWTDSPDGKVRIAYVGMNIRLEFAASHRGRPSEETICNIVRVLGSKDKLEILRRCAHGPVSAARLAEAMNLNSGTVSRNLYALFKLGYLETIGDGERVNYITKLEMVNQIFRWVVEYISDDHN